jgi:NCAIR mutase (PurE)-related protein
MEGALPSLITGLVRVPVIGVPTSVGYGAHLDGLAPLLTMVNSCAAGLGVVNVDNGFGAAALAHRINSVCPDPGGHDPGTEKAGEPEAGPDS